MELQNSSCLLGFLISIWELMLPVEKNFLCYYNYFIVGQQGIHMVWRQNNGDTKSLQHLQPWFSIANVSSSKF